MEEQKIRKKYLLTLFRQGVYFDENSKSDSDLIGDKESCFFSSDYFDKLIVEEIKPDMEMAVFIGMKQQPKHRQAADVIAVHNYALFQDIAKSEENYTESIFDANNREFPYFALIHVYVNPDILAGVAERFCSENYIEYFERDLKETVEQCKRQNDIRVMVFKTLSASDFIIIVRSKCPEDVFGVSTVIRRRKICKENNKNEFFSVYKTYTILTLNGTGLSVIGEESGETEEVSKVGTVAIRGRFSNRYWSQKDVEVQKLKIPETLNNLNGKYDFLLHLTMEDFWEIYPLLCQAKGIKTGLRFIIGEEERGNYSEELLYLYDLIEYGYLSYFNERYLVGAVTEVAPISTNSEQTEYMNEIFLDDAYDTSKFMFDSNNEECDNIITRIKEMQKEFEGNQFTRKSLPGLLELLTNLVYLCQRVNGLSDVRIYVISLLKQMNIVLNSLSKWIEVYNDKNDDSMLNFMEDYLRQSVVSLEAYGTIIRNNNFQTLQSPQYNVITGISMEKILIGYSRFLYTIMNYCYKKLSMETEEEGTYYLPLMVPQLSQDTLSVEVVFPEWQIGESDRKYLENEYLMIATGPANSEIVDISYIVTTLFHEIAHQLRYESREERNEILCRIVIEDMVNSLIHDMFTIVVEAETKERNTSEIQAICVKIFSDLLVDIMKNELKPYSNWSLENYKGVIQIKLQEFLMNIKRDNNQVMAMVTSFINDTNEYICNTQEVMKLLGELSKKLQILTGEYKWEEESQKDTFINWMKTDRVGLEEYIKGELIREIKKYTELCQENNSEMEESEKISLSRMQEAVITNIRETQLLYKDNDKREKFYNDFYEKICEGWAKYLRKEDYILGRKKEWIRQGRRLGIDYKGSWANREKFCNYLEKAIDISDKYEFKNAMKRISLYREETSDLFMCSFCDLDLISYLSVSAHGYPIDNGRYADGYIERLVDVVLIQWCIEDEEDINELKPEELCKAELFGGVWRVLNPIDTKEYTDTEDLIKQLKEYVEKEEKDIKKNVANLSIQILEQTGKRISWFKERGYLLIDYLKGKEKYKQLREKFMKEKNYGFQAIIELCNINKEYLNSLGDADLKLRENYQRRCEDFILENYYCDKILNAKRR